MNKVTFLSRFGVCGQDSIKVYIKFINMNLSNFDSVLGLSTFWFLCMILTLIGSVQDIQGRLVFLILKSIDKVITLKY